MVGRLNVTGRHFAALGRPEAGACAPNAETEHIFWTALFSWCAVVGLGTGGVAGDVTMNRLVLLAFAVPLGCLALLSSLALLGILTLGGALHLVGRIRAVCMVVSTKMNPRPSLSH